MVLSDISIKRPVICLVASILIVLIGILAFRRLRSLIVVMMDCVLM